MKSLIVKLFKKMLGMKQEEIQIAPVSEERPKTKRELKIERRKYRSNFSCSEWPVVHKEFIYHILEIGLSNGKSIDLVVTHCGGINRNRKYRSYKDFVQWYWNKESNDTFVFHAVALVVKKSSIVSFKISASKSMPNGFYIDPKERKRLIKNDLKNKKCTDEYIDLYLNSNKREFIKTRPKVQHEL